LTFELSYLYICHPSLKASKVPLSVIMMYKGSAIVLAVAAIANAQLPAVPSCSVSLFLQPVLISANFYQASMLHNGFDQ